MVEKLIEIVRETDAIFFDINKKNDISKKGEADFVTRADIEISSFLHRRLKEEYPSIEFFSEEEKGKIDAHGEYFILDPIDGTTNFIHNLSLCAVSLAYCRDGKLLCGVSYLPITRELFYAEKGKGAYLNGERISCAKREKLSDCLCAYEFNAYFKDSSDEALRFAEKIYLSCSDIRTLGSAAASLAYLACGRIDAFLGRYLKPWDYAAGAVIVSEAGGRISDFCEGLPITQLNTHILAATQEIYPILLKALR